MSIGENFVFGELVYQRPDFKQEQIRVNDACKNMKEATSYDEVRQIIMEDQKVTEELAFHYALAFTRNYQDCKDEFYQNEVQQIMSEALLLNTEDFKSAILNSTYRKEIQDEFGEAYLNRLRSEINLKSNGKEIMVQEQTLVLQYQQLKANLEINYNDKIYSEAEINALFCSSNREERRTAKIAYFNALLKHKEEFSNILKQIVSLRIQIAKANGYDSYIDYMNEEKGRRSYTEKELVAFSNQVKESIVPLYRILKDAQAKRLGLTRLAYHDITVLFLEGNPKPAGDADYLLEAARKMYSDLSPETKEFFKQMLQHQMLDIKASPNKISNIGFCEPIQKLQLPFVFGNCNGTIDDVTVLTHEVGHAFQFYLAMREQTLSEYFSAVNDVAEIPSKTMELFAYPYAEEFCGKDADKFRFSHLQGIIEEICAYCSYNEFENYLYSNPEASMEEWVQAYNRIIAEYEADIDFTGYETFLEQGLLLYRNMAVYMFPKYVISYALSEMGALQLNQKWHEDKEEAWNDYRNLCKAGGSMEYDGLMVCANLQPAYVEGSVKNATKQVKQEILTYLQKESLQ